MSDRDDTLTVPQLERIAGKALKFQRYIFRRAWGIYYAIWAAGIAAYSLSYPIMAAMGIQSNSLPWYFYAGFYGGIGIVAGIASAWIFRNAARAAHLRRVLEPNTSTRLTYWLMGLFWLAFYVLIGISFGYFGLRALALVYAMLLVVAGFVYFQLRLSFSKDIPFEGKFAVVSYTIASVASLISTIVTPSDFTVELVSWTAVVVIWLFCALYSIKCAPEELVELSF